MVWGDVETVFGRKSGISDFICTFVSPFRLRLVADYDRGIGGVGETSVRMADWAHKTGKRNVETEYAEDNGYEYGYEGCTAERNRGET